jgi:hypothetical protein
VVDAGQVNEQLTGVMMPEPSAAKNNRNLMRRDYGHNKAGFSPISVLWEIADDDNRAAQTGVFDLDIPIFNRLFIDVCTSCGAETGLKSRNVEKRINAV